jgi:enamine deaminase RidA (YjgF/YER057c/UK114 family)
MDIEMKLKELGIVLPAATTATANYSPCVQEGNLVFVSGHGPFDGGKPVYTGRVGAELTESQGYEAARCCALAILATIKEQYKDLNRVDKIIKVLGFIGSAPGFDRQPFVLNGASDLFMSVFGEKGRHARSAIGTCQLPLNIPVEVEVILKIKE